MNEVKVIFVGQGPNRELTFVKKNAARIPEDRRDDMAIQYCDRLAITGACGQFIADLLGMSFASFLNPNWMHRRNLNGTWNGKISKGDVFDVDAGRRRAHQLLTEFIGHDKKFVLLGKKVAECFGWRQPEFLQSTLAGVIYTNQNMFCLPHPSRINVWWNEHGNRKRAATALKAFLGTDAPQVCGNCGCVVEEVGCGCDPVGA